MLREAYVRLRLLGGFSIELIGPPARAIRISSRKGRGLLAYLVLCADCRAGREHLADLLWGDRSDSHARQSLRQCLVSLRSELQPFAPNLLRVESETVSLDARLFTADALDFAASAEAADDISVVQGAKLYTGEFLAGIDMEVEAFDQWVREQRTRFAALAMHAFALAVARLEAAGDGHGAIAKAEQLVRLDPLREDAQRLLLRLYARYRGRDAALAHARSIASILSKELDVEPAPETIALIDEIRQGKIATVPANQMPQPPESPPKPSVGAFTSVEPPLAQTRKRSAWAQFRLGTAALNYALIALIIVIGAFWWAFDRWSSTQSIAMRMPAAAPESSRAESSWQSPPIFPGRAIDQARLAAKGIRAVIVLPFSTEEGAGKTEQLYADRITEDLINDLSRAPTLRVIARQTSRLYRGREIDVAAIGAELGVRYVIEGSLRAQGSTVRVNVALIDAHSSLQIWSERFERDQADRFDVQDEIARGLARRLQLGIATFEADEPRDETSAEPGIRETLAKGWGIMLRVHSTGSFKDADVHFQSVLRQDPDNVSALVGMAAFHINEVTMLLVPEHEPTLGYAESQLRRALTLSADSAAAHYFLGVLLRVRGELQPALEYFARALALNPSMASAHAQVGHVLSQLGKPDEAMQHIGYAMRLSPKDPFLGIWLTFGGIAEVNRGNDLAAVDWLTRALSTTARNPLGHMALAAAYSLQGDKGAGARHVAALKEIAPGHTNKTLLQWFLGPRGEAAQGQRIMRGLRTVLGAQS